MTDYTVTSCGDSVMVPADSLTTRSDGSIWFLRKVGNTKPVEMEPVLVIAGGHWETVWAPVAEPDDPDDPDDPAEPRILEQATDIPDVLDRRSIVEMRLASLDHAGDDGESL